MSKVHDNSAPKIILGARDRSPFLAKPAKAASKAAENHGNEWGLTWTYKVFRPPIKRPPKRLGPISENNNFKYCFFLQFQTWPTNNSPKEWLNFKT